MRMNSIQTFRDEIDTVLYTYLPPVDSDYHQDVLEAMKYSFTIGGKRIRPMLIHSGYLMCGGSLKDKGYKAVEIFMSAMEMIHTYSLIHDDLPAMDDDDLRRGRPTCHKVYGEANAILAGDGLLNYAYEMVAGFMAEQVEDNPLECKKWIKSLALLGSHAGVYGMIGGQAADMKFEASDHQTMDGLEYIHRNKTGALIRSSLMIGGTLAGCNEEDLEKLGLIGDKIGLSFQIQDDLLDRYSSEEVLGKPIGSDEKNHKMTYVGFVGEDQSRKDIKDYLDESMNLANEFSGDTGMIRELIDFLSTRKY